MSVLVGKLKGSLDQRGDFGEVFTPTWTTLDSGGLGQRPVYLERDGRVTLGDLFELSGSPDGSIRLVGDMGHADRVAAGLSEGTVIIEGDVGAETGVGMVGGVLEVKGNAGPRAGAAPLGYKRGMSGGELIVHGHAGVEAGAAMRRGILAIGGSAGDRAGLGMIAGTIILFGSSGKDPGLWSKRGSVVALKGIEPPPTYVYACTYQPVHLRVMLGRLRTRFELPVQRKHLSGSYRRYSGDMAELGRGEILAWTAP